MLTPLVKISNITNIIIAHLFYRVNKEVKSILSLRDQKSTKGLLTKYVYSIIIEISVLRQRPRKDEILRKGGGFNDFYKLRILQTRLGVGLRRSEVMLTFALSRLFAAIYPN